MTANLCFLTVDAFIYICSYLSVVDVANLERVDKRTNSLVMKGQIWKLKSKIVMDKYRYRFLLKLINIAEDIEQLRSRNAYKLITAMTLLTAKWMKIHLQCCFWEERCKNLLINQSECDDNYDADHIDEMSLAEFRFTIGDTIDYQNDTVLVRDDNLGVDQVDSFPIIQLLDHPDFHWQIKLILHFCTLVNKVHKSEIK